MADNIMTDLVNEAKERKWGITSAVLHIIAMALMLCDHAWGTILGEYVILNDIGRIAYPIFAFMLVEGFFHTSNLKKYILRLLVFAVVSEIPFNLMTNGVFFYPFHQNVMWTFIIGLLLMAWISYVRKKGKLWLTILISALAILVGFLGGMATFVDYFGFGVLVILVFYFFRGKKWWCYVGQVVCLYYIFVEGLGGYCHIVTIFGHTFEVVQEGFALFALIPIWLYNGKKGYHKKWFQYFCYAFYPAHILILYLLRFIVRW